MQQSLPVHLLALPRMIGSASVRAALPWPALIDTLRKAMTEEVCVPLRHPHVVATEIAESNVLLLMPAWQTGKALGVKIVTETQGNGSLGLLPFIRSMCC